MNGSVGGVSPRPGPIHNLNTTQLDAFSHGCGRRDCLHGSASTGCEFHGNLIREIIKSRRDERRARLQQRCRTHNDAMALAASTAAAIAASANRNVTPLRQQLSQISSNKPDSPRSTTSSEFSTPCVSPLMEDLMLEITGAIESSSTTPENITISPRRTASAFDMDDMFKLIEEAQREYESLAEPTINHGRNEVANKVLWPRKNSWDSLLGPL